MSTCPDRLEHALAVVAEECGFQIITIYAPGHEEDDNAEVLAMHFARSEQILLESCMKILTPDDTEARN